MFQNNIFIYGYLFPKGVFSLALHLKVHVDSPNLGFPYFNPVHLSVDGIHGHICNEQYINI